MAQVDARPPVSSGPRSLVMFSSWLCLDVAWRGLSNPSPGQLACVRCVGSYRSKRVGPTMGRAKRNGLRRTMSTDELTRLPLEEAPDHQQIAPGR